MKVLVVAAHPDDEVLGCGATIARHAAMGDTVDIIFVSDGETSRPENGGADGLIANREEMAASAASLLGASDPICLRYPDNRLDTVPLLDIVKSIAHYAQTAAPSCVYTHSSSDVNVDHRIVHQAVRTAIRPLAGISTTKIMAFEIPSSTEWGGRGFGTPFEPTIAVDVERYLDIKLQALTCYEAELREMPHPRSRQAIEALMQWRGAQFGVPCAEVFELVREVVR